MGLFFMFAAMVFGFRASSNSWEPFRSAIKTMAAIYFAQRGNDVLQYKRFMRMITLSIPEPRSIQFTRATPCSLNKGNVDNGGNQLPPQPKIYVDDAMVCAVWHNMALALRCLPHAIFTICGQPEEHLRQCPLALDKWDGMIVAYKATLLGLVINSRDMTVSMMEEYVAELHKLLNEMWHGARKTFHLNELEVLLGKGARLGESVNWVFHLLTHMYRSTAFALKANREHWAEKSASFSAYIKRSSSCTRNKPSRQRGTLPISTLR
jgi:hypothetical protein